ncbi:MAG: hypothetical protein K2Y37_16125 [Pirellulales bacterium]|nr:hypothetical protein [Pirellulales bacterium]
MLPCLSLWLGLVSLAAADVADIERQAVEYRRGIRSGEVVVKCDYHNSRAAELHIWWDGDSFRQDVLLGDRRKVDVWHEGKYLRFSDELGDNGTKTRATVAFANDRGQVGIAEPNDPRRVGMATDDFLNLVHSPIDEFLANPARKNTELRPEALAGRECMLVTITRLNGASVRAWIDPQRGPSVLRMEVEFKDASRWLRNTIELEVAVDKPSGLWFPVKCHYERKSSRPREERTEDCTIQVISLNQPIPPEVFTFAGIGVPVGWPVSDRTRPDIDRQLAWDGQAVVTVERAADTARAATRTNVIYLAGALVLAAVALVLLWRFFSLRRQSS